MKLAAARGIAEVVTDEDLSEDYVIPSVFNRDVAPTVAKAVVEEAKAEGLARFTDETGTYEMVGPATPVGGHGPGSPGPDASRPSGRPPLPETRPVASRA